MTRPVQVLWVTLLLTICWIFTVSAADPFARTPHKIYLNDDEALRELSQYNLDIDRPSVTGEPAVEAFLNQDEVNLVRALGYRVESIPNPAYEMYLKLRNETAGTDDPMDDYHSYDEMVTELQNIAAANPDLCQLHNVGSTNQGRVLWFMEISDNVGVEEDELEFRYIAAIHGDEVVGKEMCMYLINYLVDEYGIDPQVTELVNETEIWIMPSMNPDGTDMGIRYNANGVDLNRNFPDRVDDPINTTAGREIETANVMNWSFAHQPIFSANFHGGTLVANYPWDNCFDPQANYYLTDDNDIFLPAAETYSFYNTPMWNNNSGSFTNGTVNGIDWYAVFGGLQDWSYIWMGDMDITMEISYIKWPAASTLPGYWEDNRTSMLEYMAFAHRGVRGVVTDQLTGQPLLAEVQIQGRDDFTAYTDPDVGDYHRPLMPGTYAVDISSFGYWTAHLTDVEVIQGDPVRYDVALEPADLITYSGTLHNLNGGGLNARLVLVDTPYDPVDTNPDGSFSFIDVYEGEYLLRIFNLDDHAVIDVPVVLQSGMDPLELWGPVSLYYDGFESGIGNWSAEGTWGLSGNAYTGTQSVADSPGGSYSSSLNISLTQNSNFELTDYDYGTLSYYVTFNCESNYDTLFAEVSPNGSSWEKAIYHNSKQDWWTLETYDLAEYLSGDPLHLRFRLQTDGSVTRDGGFIDDVCIGVASTTPLTQTVDISLTPYGTPIQIPATGGSFDFNISAANNGSAPANVEVWCDVTLPSGSSYGPVLGPAAITIPASQSINRDRTQNVPGNAPGGTYLYNAYLGTYPDNILAQDQFSFEKLGVDDSAPGDWFNSGDEFSTTAVAAPQMPGNYILAQNYPNPFNPVTQIHYALPQAGPVTLTVYNSLGQKLMTLVDGYREAGWQEVTWDATDLATGLYVYQLEAGGHLLSRKAVLVK